METVSFIVAGIGFIAFILGFALPALQFHVIMRVPTSSTARKSLDKDSYLRGGSDLS